MNYYRKVDGQCLNINFLQFTNIDKHRTMLIDEQYDYY